MVPLLRSLRPMSHRWVGMIAGGALLAGCSSGPSATSAGPAPTPATAPASNPAASSGVGTAGGGPGRISFTTAQADRGQQVFGTVCGACHGVQEFQGRLFEMTWKARPIGDFFQHISTAMPQDNPGSLSPAEYAAVVAFVLRLNGAAAGNEELPADVRRLATATWED